MELPNSSMRLLVYGGSGYVGSKVLEVAAGCGAVCTSVSRSGQVPVHLQRSKPGWLERVDWLAGDACQPDPELLRAADVVICLVGSAPVPTFSRQAFERQVRMNGSTNCAVMAAAQRLGVKRLVLLSAHIPALLRSSRFGYFVGKQQAFEAALNYAAASDDNAITVIRPSAIYGTRYTRQGTAIPLAWLMAPIAALLRRLPDVISRRLPESPVALEQVAHAVVSAALAPASHGLVVVENRELLAKS